MLIPFLTIIIMMSINPSSASNESAFNKFWNSDIWPDFNSMTKYSKKDLITYPVNYLKPTLKELLNTATNKLIDERMLKAQSIIE